MTPVAFAGCPGMLHEADGDTAIVMCGAPGYEQLCAQRGWRDLAEGFAARGYPALRFDWPGCGDSLGGDDDPARVAAWEAGLEAALTFAREQLHARNIVLVGLRFGAAIAASVAARHGGVDGLVMLGPALSGRLYGRELAGLARVMAPDPGAEGLSVAGFRVTSETLEAMKAIDLRKLAARPAPRALVFAPEGQLGIEEMIAHWRALDCDARLSSFPGYAEWLAEPTFSQTPDDVFQQVVDWVAEQLPHAPSARQPGPIAAPRLSGDGFNEEPRQFGPGGGLYGVLCEPANRPKQATVAIFVNAGANPHIGWARMNVDGARALAKAGFASLRMDVAGLGDSSPRAGRSAQVMYDLALCADIGAAIDLLAREGYGRFVVIGLCSGAHTAFHSAVADGRIGGIVMANLQKFIWRDDYSLAIAVRQAYRSTDSYKRGAFQLGTYKRLWRGEINARGIAGEMGRRLRRLAGARLSALARLARDGDDESSRVRRWFRQLNDRGARILLVYSVDDGGIDELALHWGAGGKGLRKLAGVERAMIENADHNLTQSAARARLFALIEPFMRAQQAAQAEASADNRLQGVAARHSPATPHAQIHRSVHKPFV